MRPWRKLHSSILESEHFMDVPLESKVLFFLLVAAQDDTGYYPWERIKVRTLVATCGWSEAQAKQHADALVSGGMATWEEGGIVLRKGQELNGQLRGDREPVLYQRHTTDIPLTVTDIPVVNPEKEESKSKSKSKIPPIVPLGRGTLSEAQKGNFDVFWAAYPRKEAKGAAEKAWLKIKPDDTLCQTILTALTKWSATRRWREEPQFIPHPATWLNTRRWEDEISDERSTNGQRQHGRGATADRRDGGVETSKPTDYSPAELAILAEHPEYLRPLATKARPG